MNILSLQSALRTVLVYCLLRIKLQFFIIISDNPATQLCNVTSTGLPVDPDES